jgi:rubrerythrin
MADGHGGEGDPFAAATLTGRETLGDILTLAIGLEKKSVLFYLGLRDMVPPKLGGKRIEKIIEEEKSHIAALFRERRALRGA